MLTPFRMFIGFILISFISIFPFSISYTGCGPFWALILLYQWNVEKPISLKLAWSLGLFWDFLHYSLIAEHALIFLLIQYLILRIYNRFQYFGILQRICFLFSLCLLYGALFHLIAYIQGISFSASEFFTSVFYTFLFAYIASEFFITKKIDSF